MSASQLPRDQASIAVPSVEIQDYDYDHEYGWEPDDDYYQDLTTPKQSKHASLPVRSKKSKSKHKSSSHAAADLALEPEDPPTSPSKMSHHSSSKHSSSSSSKKDKSSSKKKHNSDDWSDVLDPEERRRIQNRVAQRKFREKAREQRERTHRDSQNQQYAAASYEIPSPEALPSDTSDLSGLPWGSVGMQYMVARGHDHASQRGGSRRASDQHPHLVDPVLLSPQVRGAGAYATGHVSSFDNSSGDDAYYQDSPYGGYCYDFDAGSGDGSTHM